MIAKRWLKNISAGMLGSFMGRNNDFIGYWAPGILYTETRESGNRAKFDLLAVAARPVTPACIGMAQYWSDYLRIALLRHGSTVDDFEAATISVAFGLSPVPRPRRHMSVGDTFSCSVCLVSRQGDVVVRDAMDFCLPHALYDGRRSGRYRG